MKHILIIFTFIALAATAQQKEVTSDFQGLYYPAGNNRVSNSITSLGASLPQAASANIWSIQNDGWIGNKDENKPVFINSPSFYYTTGDSLINWTTFGNSTGEPSMYKAAFSTYLTSVVPDSLATRFYSYTDISKIVSKSRTEIGSFEFLDHVLVGNKGELLPTSTTVFSSSFSSTISAGPGNGGTVTQKGIYQTDWLGAGDNSYAALKSPYGGQPVSFTLVPAANLAGNNQQGYFSIRTNANNSFSLGTVNSITGIVGFSDPDGTTLQLSAGTIQSSGEILHNGLFRTSLLEVSDDNTAHLTPSSSSLAVFRSYYQTGAQIEVSNESLSANAYSAISLSQNNILSRIITYSPNDRTVYLPGSMTFETNSPSGFVFSSQSNNSDAFHVIINSKEAFSISVNSVDIPTALQLRGISDDEMLQMQVEEGTLVNNTSRKTLVYSDGKDWYEVQLKKIKPKKQLAQGKLL